jgi:hypothetical protein
MTQHQAAKALCVEHKTIHNDLGKKSPKTGEKFPTKAELGFPLNDGVACVGGGKLDRGIGGILPPPVSIADRECRCN